MTILADTRVMFEDAPEIEKVVVEKGVTKLEAYMFENCENIKEVVIPNSVKK